MKFDKSKTMLQYFISEHLYVFSTGNNMFPLYFFLNPLTTLNEIAVNQKNHILPDVIVCLLNIRMGNAPLLTWAFSVMLCSYCFSVKIDKDKQLVIIEEEYEVGTITLAKLCLYSLCIWDMFINMYIGMFLFRHISMT